MACFGGQFMRLYPRLNIPDLHILPQEESSILKGENLAVYTMVFQES